MPLSVFRTQPRDKNARLTFRSVMASAIICSTVANNATHAVARTWIQDAANVTHRDRELRVAGREVSICRSWRGTEGIVVRVGVEEEHCLRPCSNSRPTRTTQVTDCEM